MFFGIKRVNKGINFEKNIKTRNWELSILPLVPVVLVKNQCFLIQSVVLYSLFRFWLLWTNVHILFYENDRNLQSIFSIWYLWKFQWNFGSVRNFHPKLHCKPDKRHNDPEFWRSGCCWSHTWYHILWYGSVSAVIFGLIFANPTWIKNLLILFKLQLSLFTIVSQIILNIDHMLVLLLLFSIQVAPSSTIYEI